MHVAGWPHMEQQQPQRRYEIHVIECVLVGRQHTRVVTPDEVVYFAALSQQQSDGGVINGGAEWQKWRLW